MGNKLNTRVMLAPLPGRKSKHSKGTQSYYGVQRQALNAALFVCHANLT